MDITQSKQAALEWLEENQADFNAMADQIWATPELAFQEFVSSKIQADYLEQAGFEITWHVGGLNTAFVAAWGQGQPVIGFIGEYDALPALSQKVQTSKAPIEADAPGHGCGHNLLGTAAVASAVAVKNWMEAENIAGTVRYYGCPAEEKGSGKVFMARDGAFDDLDAAFNFHPGMLNAPSKGTNVGVNAIYYRFFGRTSHAGSLPYEGRSALDAVELMNVGVNYLREHVKSDVRMHYIITDGGKAPNIVPDEAEVYYFIRAAKPDDLAEVVERVRKVAEGAALMTETRVEIKFEEGCSAVLNNHYLADLQYEAMKLVGPIEYTPAEIEFAQEVNQAYGKTNSDYINRIIENHNLPPEFEALLDTFRAQPLVGANFPAIDENTIRTGSTDVGDLSQITPVSMLRTACAPSGVVGHSWGNVAACGMSIGHKGMLHAAKIMAVAALDLYHDPTHLEKIQSEFHQKRGSKPYISPIPAHVKPPQYDPPAG